MHEKIILSSLFNRNYPITHTAKSILIVLFFFWSAMFQYMVVFLEFAHIFMIFTLRPFKEEFYLNTKVVCRLIFLTWYILIVLGNLYFSLGPIVFNYGPVSSYILARDILFHVLILGIFIAIFFEIYFKCTNLSYNINLVKEADQFKLELSTKTRIKN